MSLAFRPWAEGDRQFVIETFLDSYRTAHCAGLIQIEDWKAVMGPQIKKLFDREGSVVIVAYNPNEAAGSRADLYGWIAVERGHAHPHVTFVYIKQPYRRLGITRRLFIAAEIDPTQRFDYAARTPVLAKLKHAMPLARWSPLDFRFPRRNPEETTPEE